MRRLPDSAALMSDDLSKGKRVRVVTGYRDEARTIANISQVVIVTPPNEHGVMTVESDWFGSPCNFSAHVDDITDQPENHQEQWDWVAGCLKRNQMS